MSAAQARRTLPTVSVRLSAGSHRRDLLKPDQVIRTPSTGMRVTLTSARRDFVDRRGVSQAIHARRGVVVRSAMGRAERERIILEHIAAENRGDAEATVGTFAVPRYEVVPTGEVHEGAAAVGAFLSETMRTFPDLQ